MRSLRRDFAYGFGGGSRGGGSETFPCAVYNINCFSGNVGGGFWIWGRMPMWQSFMEVANGRSIKAAVL